MKRFILTASLAGLVLGGCTTTQIDQARDYQARLAGACKIAMAADTGWAATWIKGACESEVAIAALALDSTSLDWLRSLVIRTGQKSEPIGG
jgi:hypothetical protein